jgi:hypothetical protein
MRPVGAADDEYHRMLGCRRQQHTHLSRASSSASAALLLQVLRFDGELCNITWGLRQGDLEGVDLRWRGTTREAMPTLTVG